MSNTVSYSYDINYISQQKKILVGRNNNTIYQKFKLDNQIQDTYYFQVVSKNNQLVDLSGFDYQFFGSYIDAKQTLHVLFFSDEYTIENNVLSFKVNTYTNQYLNYVKVPREIELTIKKKANNLQQVILRDTGLAYPSPIIPGQEPTEVIAGFGLDINGFLISLTGTVLSGDNSTIAINDNVISYIGPSGITYTAGEGIGISEENVISLTATIPSSITQLDGNSNLIRTISEQNSISAYYLNSVPEGGCTWKVGIDYDSLHNAGFAYTSAIPSSMEQLDGHTRYLTAIVPQNALTSIHYGLSQQKVGINYTLLHNAGFAYTSAIPTSTSQLTNDSGFITNSALANYATTGALDTVSSAIPLSTSQLVNDSGFLTEVPITNKQKTLVDNTAYQSEDFSLAYDQDYDIYVNTLATSGGTLTINKVQNYNQLSNGDIATFEHWIIPSGTLTGITLSYGVELVGDIPSEFTSGCTQVFTRRLHKNEDGVVNQQISYAYEFNNEEETEYVPLTLKCLDADNCMVSIGAWNNNPPQNPVTIYYSVNGGEWTENTGDMIYLNKGDTIALSSTSDTLGDSVGQYNIHTWFGSWKIYGNINSLVNQTSTITPYMFSNFFRECKGTLYADELILPYMNLANKCYKEMFRNSDLKLAPVLPATGLAYECYDSMFAQCPKLITAPQLPATDLSNTREYQGMFDRCTSLKYAPSLPAEYVNAFSYCRMFAGCTSLQKAPKLAWTTLNNGSAIGSLFQGCSNLSSIEVNFDTWTEGANDNWVSGVAQSGIFVCPSNLPIEYGDSKIPNGWTVIRK